MLESSDVVDRHIQEHHPDHDKCLFCDHRAPTTYAYKHKPNYLKQHIKLRHPNATYHQISQQQLDDRGFHLCRPCNNNHGLYLRQGNMNNCTKHIVAPTTHDNNLDIVMSTYRHSNADTWKIALSFLYNLNPTVVPWRTSIVDKMNASTRPQYNKLRHQIETFILKSYTLSDNDQQQPHLTSPDALVQLYFQLDSLIFAPVPADCTLSNNDVIKRRIQQLKAGHIRHLYNESRSTPPPTPPTHDADMERRMADMTAQLAADVDNYHAAYARLTNSQAVASLTPDNVDRCRKLYVPATAYKSSTPNTRSQSRDQPIMPMDLKILKLSLQHLKRGTAAGPFGDYTDTIKSYALYSPPGQDTYPHLETFSKIVHLFTSGRLSPRLHHIFSANYFMALHKDPEDLTKLRPIGMGTALRRVVGKYAVELLKESFARILQPQGQYGIALKGGLQYMVDTIRTQISRFINTTNPTRVLLLLDLENMFNNTSREATREFIQTTPELHCLLPLYDTLYNHTNYCYYFKPNATIDFFEQEEGHAQGCTLTSEPWFVQKHLLCEQQDIKDRCRNDSFITPVADATPTTSQSTMDNLQN